MFWLINWLDLSLFRARLVIAFARHLFQGKREDLGPYRLADATARLRLLRQAFERLQDEQSRLSLERNAYRDHARALCLRLWNQQAIRFSAALALLLTGLSAHLLLDAGANLSDALMAEARRLTDNATVNGPAQKLRRTGSVMWPADDGIHVTRPSLLLAVIPTVPFRDIELDVDWRQAFAPDATDDGDRPPKHLHWTSCRPFNAALALQTDRIETEHGVFTSNPEIDR